jgi:hypothetical protein
MGRWVTSRPSDKASLLSTVIADTQLYGQSVITNVDTEYLSFYANEAASTSILTVAARRAARDQRWLESWRVRSGGPAR